MLLNLQLHGPAAVAHAGGRVSVVRRPQDAAQSNGAALTCRQGQSSGCRGHTAARSTVEDADDDLQQWARTPKRGTTDSARGAEPGVLLGRRRRSTGQHASGLIESHRTSPASMSIHSSESTPRSWATSQTRARLAPSARDTTAFAILRCGALCLPWRTRDDSHRTSHHVHVECGDRGGTLLVHPFDHVMHIQRPRGSS